MLRRRAGVSVHRHPSLCRCPESAAPAADSNSSGAAGAKVQNSKWRLVMRRVVSLCLPRQATADCVMSIFLTNQYVAKIDTGSRRLAPNPTSRKDHSDLLQFHFFNQNEIRIELIAERAACRIDGHSSAGHDAAEPAVEADRFQPYRSPCGRSTDAAPMVQAACCLIFAPEAFGPVGA
jgi:hypothetical protein